jgi:TonB family protein
MLTDTSEFRLTGAKPSAERGETEYLDWAPGDSPLAIHMSLGAVDGIARDVLEGLGSAALRDAEVGGLLLGRVAPGGNDVWIERYQRISCEHSFGPHFILAEEDTAALEQAATKLFETREVAVVGLYRSHTRPGLQLEASDFDLIRRYFSDPTDLVLLIKPGKGNNLFAQFYRFDTADVRPIGDRFPFRGSVVIPDTRLVTPDTARTVASSHPVDDTPDDREKTRAHESLPEAQPPTAAAIPGPRRLVPDYPATPVEPAPSLFGLSVPLGAENWHRPVESTEALNPNPWRKWMPLVAALVLVGGIAWFLIGQGRIGSGTNRPVPETATQTARPLGLYVDPQGPTWRVLWNTTATALHDARSVQLFVREGDDQNRIDLSSRDLATGSYEYHPVGNDVTFRLEVADKAGQISAESFRLTQGANASQAAAQNTAKASAKSPLSLAAQQAAPPAATSSALTPPEAPTLRSIQPKPIYRAPPVVASGVRPRIKGTVPIDVRVHIDEHGHVTTATLITKVHDALDEYLASRALAAARQWRFEPALQKGKPVQGTQTIHFSFTK